jgi:hypothetical protein
MRSVVYISTASYEMRPPELEALLVEARQLNNRYGITGVLLHGDGRFMQCFEGPEQAVEETYARIRASRRHRDLIELSNERVRSRSFSAWDMGLAEPAASMLLALSTARWTSKAVTGSAQPLQSPGFQLLLEFWRGAKSLKAGA